MTTLDRGMLALTDEALEARRAGDRELFEAKLAAAELLDARYDEAARGPRRPGLHAGLTVSRVRTRGLSGIPPDAVAFRRPLRGGSR